MRSVPLRRTCSACASRPFERRDLGLQFGDGARRGGLIDDLLLGLFDFVVWRFVEIVEVVGVVATGMQPSVVSTRRLGATLQQLLFAQPLLQALAAPLERLVDGLG